jgi:hypothetical protein
VVLFLIVLVGTAWAVGPQVEASAATTVPSEAEWLQEE